MVLRIIALVSFCCLACAAPADDIDRLLRSGQSLLTDQNWKEAEAQFQRVVKVAPGNAAAHFGLALAYRGSGQAQKATAEARAALKLQPAFDDAQLLLGLLLQQQGDVASALIQYRAVLRRNPRSAEAHNWLGVAYMQKNALKDAEYEFRAALKANPDFVRAWNNLGSTLAQAGDVKEGIGAFREGLKKAPADLQLRLNLGTALRTVGDSDGAITELRSVLLNSPNNPEIHYQIGLALREKGDRDAAVAEFEMALQLDPEYREGYYSLGQTLQQIAAALRRGRSSPVPEQKDLIERGLNLARRGDVHSAVEELRKAVAVDAGSPEAHFHLGAALWYAGQGAQAAEALDAALRLDPAAAPAVSLRGVVFRESGDLESARRMFQRAVALQPDSPTGYFDLALLFLRSRQLERALGQFEAGLNLPPAPGPAPDLDVATRELRAALQDSGSADGQVVLGRLLGYAGADSRDVIAAFEAALRLRPDSAAAHNSLGLVYLQTGDDAKAAASFREAIRLRSDYADAHANLGALLTATDAAKAVAELEQAVALQPGLLKAQYNLAIAYGSSPKHGADKEIATLRKLLALRADYPRAEFALGKALLRKGAVSDAVVHLERAAQTEPQFGEAQYQLGLALSRAGRTSEAAKWLKSGRELVAATERDQTVLLDMTEGKAALAKNEFEAAAAKFRSVIRQRPDLPEAHYGLGVALAGTHDAAAAGESLRKALELNPTHTAARAKLAELSAASDDSPEIARIEAWVRDGRCDEAVPLLQHFVRERSGSSWGWYALGYCLFTQKKVSDSIGALSRSLSLDITNAEAHKVLGRNLMLIGRFDAARLEFELGEKYNPASPEIASNLGRLFSMQDQWAPARAAFERALKADPSSVEAWDGLGFAQEALGDDAAALASYQRAVKLNDDRKGSFVSPLVNLSAYYNRTGDSEAALGYARRAVLLNDKSDRAWFQMARANERRGEMDAAVDALHRAIELNPRVSSYHYVLATLFRRVGKSDESRVSMETFSRLERESAEMEQKRREGLRAGAPGHD